MDQPLPQPDTVPEGAERRKFPRRSKQIQVQILGIDPNSQPLHAWLLERSLGGVKLGVHVPFPAGAMLKILPAPAPADAAWVPVKVRRCEPFEATWQLSCQFVREPSYSTLLQFG